MNQRLTSLRLLRLPLFAAILTALFVISLGALQAQTVNTTERVVFEPGENTTSIESEIGGTLVNHYNLYAGAGQELTVTVTSPGNNVYLSVYTPSGVALVRAQTGAKSYQGVLTETGDYNLRVSTTPGGPLTDYTLNVGVSGTPLPTPLPSPTPLPTSTPLPTPTPPPGATQRINFATGATNATVTGRIDGVEVDTFLVNARAGQFMQTWVTSPTNDLFLTVVSPSGSPLARAQAGAKSFSGTLPENGDYRLSVSSPSGTAHSNYSLFVSITGSTSGGGGSTTQRISFAAGATSATVTGRIDGTEIDNFLLNARAGQVMQVSVSSAANDLFLSVTSPGGTPLVRAESGAQSFNGTLPENGDYRLTVLSTSGTAHSNYTLFVSVTGSGSSPAPTPTQASSTTQRINFAPGATSASVTGSVDGGSTRTYLVNAQEGQRMQIAVTSSANNVYLTVTTPSGATMISAELGQTSLDRFLPESGDYRITASTQPGTALTNFTLYVTII